VPGFYYGSYYFSTVAEVTKKHFFTSCRNPNLLATLLTTHNFSKTSNHKPQTTASMNSFLFALLSLLLVASTAAATRKQWSGNVKMQIKRQAGATSQCSDQAMQTLNENISDFLHNELVTLIGREDAFSLGVVRLPTRIRLPRFSCFSCSVARTRGYQTPILQSPRDASTLRPVYPTLW
jgi:hypothetical protein